MTVHRNVNANSIDSFHSKEVQKKRLTQKDKILLAFIKIGVANDRMISELSGVSRFLIPDRRKQLVTENKLRFVEKKQDPVTKKITDFYEAVKI